MGGDPALCLRAFIPGSARSPNLELQRWSVQFVHIHVVLVIPPKDAFSSIVGMMKANLSWQLRLRYHELKGTYWGAVLCSPGFFSAIVGLNKAGIRQ
ncbi:MAG: transposase [Nitrospiraceae bacterium]|nr:transposase [Nitrospira sp.]MCA9455455.1 transposase [Nitrospira sp.]MCB9775689.1 transposase [Nitrospiraceae bacterium]